MRKLLRFGVGVLGVWALLATLLVLLSPWLLYGVGLSRFDKLPDRPARLATAEQQAWAWAQARGSGSPKVEPMNPYGFVWDLFSRTGIDARPRPDELMMSWVTREHTPQPTPGLGMGGWHLSNVALSIWLSRHWTTEEIASAAYAIAVKWPPRKPRPVSPESAASPPAR